MEKISREMTHILYVPYPNTQAWQFIKRGSVVVQFRNNETQQPLILEDYRDVVIHKTELVSYAQSVADALKEVSLVKTATLAAGALHHIGWWDGNKVVLRTGAEECLMYWLQTTAIADRDLTL